MLLDNRMAEALGLDFYIAQRAAKDQATTNGRYAWNWRARRGIAKMPKGLELVIIGTVQQVHVKNGKPITKPVKVGIFVDKGKKYTGEKLRALRAERGVGKRRGK
jgi:hypothetical protein